MACTNKTAFNQFAITATGDSLIRPLGFKQSDFIEKSALCSNEDRQACGRFLIADFLVGCNVWVLFQKKSMAVEWRRLWVASRLVEVRLKFSSVQLDQNGLSS